jgi:hypothetical protein
VVVATGRGTGENITSSAGTVNDPPLTAIPTTPLRIFILIGEYTCSAISVKEFALQHGVSPFNSEKSSLSNPDFKVFRVPFPALVLRHMDVRDIALLNSNRKAFLHFRSRYAPLF